MQGEGTGLNPRVSRSKLAGGLLAWEGSWLTQEMGGVTAGETRGRPYASSRLPRNLCRSLKSPHPNRPRVTNSPLPWGSQGCSSWARAQRGRQGQGWWLGCA